MKSCELCKSPAKIYCDSDQANLCWTCDSKVHSANFLVARHSRTLLCRTCRSPTPWTASGEKIGPSAVSICEKCLGDGFVDEDDVREESHGGNDDVDVDEYDADEDGDNNNNNNNNEIDVEDGDDNNIQVVPLSYTPPPAASSSGSDDYTTSERVVLMKRKRENAADLSSEDDVDCLSVKKVGKQMFTEEIEGNGGTLYHFLPLNSEEMGDKVKMNRQMEKKNKSGAVGLDLNSSDS